MLFQDLLNFYTRDNPNQPCITNAGVVKTYAEMDELSNQISNGLIDLGIRKGDRIGIVGENSIEHMLMFYVAAKTGAILVSFNYRLAAAEFDYVVKDSGVKILVALKGVEQILQAFDGSFSQNVRLFSNGIEGIQNFNEWSREYPATAPNCQVDQHDPLLQLYTSGTTGYPKGVVISTFNLMSFCHMRAAASDHRENRSDCGLNCMPLFHIGGMAVLAVATYIGQHIVIHESFDPVRILDDLEKYEVTNMAMVPAMIAAVLQTPGVRNRDFSKLKQINYGGSPITETGLCEAIDVFQCDFCQIYGMTETTGPVVVLSAKDHRHALDSNPGLLLSCGRPYPGTSAKVVNTEGVELPTGDVGEIWLKSPSNMLGYFNNPEATVENLTDGWVHTGDAGYIDEDGYIFLKDRIKDMVVSGSENIYPVEVENVIAKHPAVRDVAVIGVPDKKFGEALLAFIVLHPNNSLTVDDVITFCRDKIAGYKIPRQLEIITEMPRNPSGKILKKILRQPYWEGHNRAIS